tara:strand:- start:228 stop:440 length:213 start_codon:yes stop_codon:yes gene_type:complete
MATYTVQLELTGHKDIEVEAISIEEAKAIALRTFPTLKFQDIAYSIEEVIAVSVTKYTKLTQNEGTVWTI